jgi:uncharacterized protein YegL
LTWTSRVRYAILITDAPAHGRIFHNGMVDNHNKPTCKAEAEAVIAALVNLQVELVVCHVNATNTAQMAGEMARMIASAKTSNPGKLPNSEMLQINLYNPSSPQASYGGLHVVFVLDKSSSMIGHFGGVWAAYQKFVDIRRASNQGHSADLITVIPFDSHANFYAEAVPVQSAPTAAPHGYHHGTDFGPAMQLALNALNGDLSVPTRQALTPVVIFMSDGVGGSGEDQLRQIVSAHGARRLQVHVLAYGGASPEQLRAHAAAGNGVFHETPNIDSVSTLFTYIAKNTQGTAGLLEEIARQVGSAISDRLCTDYL